MKPNITKCKELIIDFSKEKRSLQPLTVNGNPIKLVELNLKRSWASLSKTT